MKKLLVLALAISVMSCQKQEAEPPIEKTNDGMYDANKLVFSVQDQEVEIVEKPFYDNAQFSYEFAKDSLHIYAEFDSVNYAFFEWEWAIYWGDYEPEKVSKYRYYENEWLYDKLDFLTKRESL